MTPPVLSGPPPHGGGPAPCLAPRELEYLHRLVQGETHSDIAAAWCVEEISVRTTGWRVRRKLRAVTNAHAVFLACRAGILDPNRRHGDHAGFAAHVRRGEDPWVCTPCAEGERTYRRGRKAARKAAIVDAA